MSGKGSVPHEVPQVLINREPLLHLNFDVELLGDCDVIVNELCHRLGGDFEQLCDNSSQLSEITDTPPPLPTTLPEQACVQTCDVQNTSQFITKDVAETSETVTVIDSCPNAQFLNYGNLNTFYTSKEARPTVELENRSSSPKPSTQESYGYLNTQPSTCRESSDTDQNAQLEAVGNSPNTQQEREGIMEMLEMQTEEKLRKERNDLRKQCWLKQICRNPISNRLGTSQYLFQVPNRYIFHGAEVYSCSEDETSSSSDNEGSCCSGFEEQESDAEEECISGDCRTPGEDGVEETVDENKHMSSIHTDSTRVNLNTATDV